MILICYCLLSVICYYYYYYYFFRPSVLNYYYYYYHKAADLKLTKCANDCNGGTILRKSVLE